MFPLPLREGVGGGVCFCATIVRFAPLPLTPSRKGRGILRARAVILTPMGRRPAIHDFSSDTTENRGYRAFARYDDWGSWPRQRVNPFGAWYDKIL